MECYKAFASGPRLHVDLADELLGEIYVGCPLIGCVTNKGIVNERRGIHSHWVG